MSIARSLVIAVLLLAGVSIGVAAMNTPRLGKPIKTVRVAGEFRYVSKAKLEDTIGHYVDHGFFDIDMDEVRARALQLAWVRDATVRRMWPESLHVAVVERVAIARWNDDGLLEDDATYFVPDSVEAFSELPLLQGPNDMRMEVLTTYRALAGEFGHFGGGLGRVSVSDRGAWEIELRNALVFDVGRDFSIDALRHYAKVLPRILGARLASAKRIDLRYSNGFAVEWKVASNELPED